MRILFVTAEIFPLAKTGGLADVSAALPAALREMGEDVRVLVPAYRQALEAAPKLKEIARFGDFLGCGETRLLETHLPKTGVPVWLIDCPQLFDRAGGPYQDENGAEWHDNAQRFAVLNHVAAGIANETGAAWRPDIVHANDWHAGLVPFLLSGRAKQPSVFTIHNLAYQGLFPFDRYDALNLPADAANRLEFYGRMSFLKAGIGAADAITTVSPTYAREILGPDYGCGMDGLLRERTLSLSGILNGADYGFWDPAIDSHLVSNYTVRSLGAKQASKRAIQAELGLDADAERPLLAFMSRLAHQKMPDTVLEILPSLIDDGIQFALVADADGHYQHDFRDLAERYPGRVAVRIGYREAIAHRLLAGADMLIHPARFEPCGLVPIYALRYGTIPIVRNSGGMADTVVDATPEAIASRTATGFHFQETESGELLACVRRGLALYRQPISWRRLQVNAMQQDFGWRRAAQSYSDLYRKLLRIPAQEHDASPAKGIPAVAQA